jgi:hypothetical protein
VRPLVFLLGAAAAALLAAALLAAAPASGSTAPARLQVTAHEFEYRLSRQTLRSGPALIELVNLGEDEHDLRLRRVGGTRTYAIAKVLPGERRVLSARLRAGRFRLWCSLADHAKRGMTASLRVR